MVFMRHDSAILERWIQSTYKGQCSGDGQVDRCNSITNQSWLYQKIMLRENIKCNCDKLDMWWRQSWFSNGTIYGAHFCSVKSVGSWEDLKKIQRTCQLKYSNYSHDIDRVFPVIPTSKEHLRDAVSWSSSEKLLYHLIQQIKIMWEDALPGYSYTLTTSCSILEILSFSRLISHLTYALFYDGTSQLRGSFSKPSRAIGTVCDIGNPLLDCMTRPSAPLITNCWNQMWIQMYTSTYLQAV